MGDITSDTFAADIIRHDKDEIRVLVTGFAPFHLRYPVNSSWSVASTLPRIIPATATCPRINLIVFEEPLKVTYHSVVDWGSRNLSIDKFDFVLHIGLAAGRKFFTLERQSMREPYWQKEDVLGQIFSREDTEKLWPASEFAPLLRPSLDCRDIWSRWRKIARADLDMRPSDDPGNYLCGFIYYYTMAWYQQQNSKECPVLFLHVPDLPTEGQVAGGREVAMCLIRAMVESRREKGVMNSHVGELEVSNVLSKHSKATPEQFQHPGESLKALQPFDDDMTWSYSR